jgi:hypothetical protein
MTAAQRPARHAPNRFSHHTAARHGEVRLPASVAVLVAAAMHATLPQDLLFGPRWLVPAIEAALLVALTLVNPTRLTTETRLSRVVSLVLVTLIIASNTVSLGYVLHALTGSHPTSGRALLLAAAQVWVTNMIAFALLFWELDRGGAVARLASSGIPAGRHDFWFPQDDPETGRLAMGTSELRWMPMFVDYLYLSITNSIAFSPTDTLPLTARAKLLMAYESIAAMVTSLLVIARAVNILK